MATEPNAPEKSNQSNPEKCLALQLILAAALFVPRVFLDVRCGVPPVAASTLGTFPSD